jgi:DNA-binding response OmpR family regulator
MRILFVENNLVFARDIKRALEMGGFAVDHHRDGTRAAEHFFVHHSAYDVAVLEEHLPGRSGREICSASRARGIDTPILILSESGERRRMIESLNEGADDYIMEPIEYPELEARVNALLRRPRAMLPVEQATGEVRLISATHRAYVGVREIRLTAKEFALLEFFLRNADTVLDRETILEHVWDFNYVSFSNVVDVHVKNIRMKLREHTDTEYIETVEGVGYRLLDLTKRHGYSARFR